MANHNLPTQTSNYTAVLTELDARLDDLALGLDPARTTMTNLPTNSVGWSSSGNKWQRWNGTAWVDLTTTYSISIAGNAATASTLQTARTINGVSFNGSANITVPTSNSITFNNAGSGVASGTTFNGNTAITVSYNTIGAPSVSGANATGTWGISISGNAATVTNGVYTTGDQSIGGNKTFTNTIAGSISGNAATATTLVANAAIPSSATATTQTEKTSNTSLATTAFVDRLRSLSTPTTSGTGTLVIGDRGSLVQATAAIAVPANIFAAGDVVTVLNTTASAISITQGSGLTMRFSGTTTTGSRSISAYGIATVVFRSATECYVSGSGVS